MARLRGQDRPAYRSSGALAAIWLLVALVLIAIPVWVGSTRFGPLLNGHPVTLAVGFGLLLIGVVAAICAVVVLVDRLRRRRAESTGARLRRRRWPVVVSAPVIVVCLVAAGFLGWSRPFPASDVAEQALVTSSTVRVTEQLTWYAMQPTREDRAGRAVPVTTGLVFYPGARVDARAYAAILRPLAEDGYLVVVLKEPFGIGLLDPGQARRIPELYPSVSRWAVGGHSLGGLPASLVAADDSDVTGLVLWASEPAAALTRAGLRVLTVSGSNDGLETPQRLEAARAMLPADATSVVVPGGVHAYFGDYGVQPGDGSPTIGRAEAQRQIVAATERFLADLPAGVSTGSGTGPSATPSRTPSPTPTR